MPIFRSELQIVGSIIFTHEIKYMEEKLQKLFSFFRKIKNEPFYTAIIAQIIQTYETCPESLKFILYNLNQLIFASTQQLKLRIKHRLICASIVAKLSLIYVNRIKRCVENDQNIDLENFQIQAEQSQGQNQLFKLPQPNDLWQKLDLLKVIETEQPLVSTKRDTGQTNEGQQKNQNKIFEQYLNMNQATMLNIEQMFKDVKTDKGNVQIAFQESKTKYQKRIQTIKKKKQQYTQKITFLISNPFNLLYQICIQNLLSPQWQLRHLSALILKQLMYYPEFIGFIGRIEINDTKITREERYKTIQTQTKDQLKQFVKNNTFKNAIYNKVIVLNLKVLCRDKFADYQSDQSNIIVRNKAAETLARCYISLTTNQQIQMLKRAKRLFDKEIKPESKSNFTWQVKHSFMVFINFIIQYPECQESTYKILQQSMVKMLITEQQIDQIVYAICKCFKKFLNQKFFGKKEAQKINEQVWKIVKNLDDISISTVSALQLLEALFPQFNLNICSSLQEIRKFFISKIPQVRKQCYNLAKMLYEKNFVTTNDKQKKLVESNIIQFLQASIAEHNKQIFQTLLSFSPSIFYQVRKERKIFQVVQFITDVVLNEEYTDKLIETKFKTFQSFGLDKNDYLFIYELQKTFISVDKYVDKRIWKVAQVVIKGFQNSYQNFAELINAIQIHSKNSDRGKLFIFHLLVKLVDIHKQEPLFAHYTKIAVQLMKLEFCDVSDGLINQYKKYFQKCLNQLKQKSPTFSQRIKNISTSLKTVKQIHELHSFLSKQKEKQYENDQKQKMQTQITIIQNLIQHQKILFRQIKILATCFFVKKEGFNLQTVNSIATSIREALEEDMYIFLSQYGAETFLELSNHLKKAKKQSGLAKIVKTTLTHIATKYNKKQLKISQIQNGYNLKADYMLGLNIYIEKITSIIPDWLKICEQQFITDYQVNQVKDTTLFLVSGTISSLLKICTVQFLNKLLSKLQPILQITQEQNKRLLYELIVSCFSTFCSNYNEKSDIFYQWFLRMLKKGHMIFLEVLTKMGEENIFKISNVCCLFVLEIVKLVSQQKSKDMAMICLSNIVVGVYMNNRTVMFGQNLQAIAEEGIQFVKNFRDASNFQYKNQVKFKKDISLRTYQQEGIQWLGFLTRFNLNGALCDDMGLGKTLQVFVLTQNQYLRDIKQQKDLLPSLIVAPTTLTEHWAYEYGKYFQTHLCSIRIINNKMIDINQQKSKKPIIYVTSYQILEKRIQMFENMNYKFIVLDEGHIIKNPKTNKFLAVKKLNGQHRFILTGTPIQNRLKELWSLFDFLMPGYLYTKEVFKSHYEKLFEVNLTTFKEDQLLFTEEQKKILQKLHLKVMPFIMRRMKSDVLKQLPEKIINDHYCNLTPEQEKLYHEFENQNHKITKGKNQENILASLSKMRKILNHPNLIGQKGTYQSSGKFIALNQLFEQLGFRQQENNIQNKAIVFSRSTSTIELLQSLFMKVLYPKLKYTKLTAAVKPNERFMVAQNFNGDNDIKVLLVTTAVGGQGLNLTSANTVIMFDHDYNPTVDMQAIDRAHRIGQKRVLNVYRLITKSTLEQRIMGIQKFKKNLAEAIVNIDNASIKNLQDSKLPQLLQNMKDLESKQKKDKIKKSFYNSLVEEMENEAVPQEDYDIQY